jgi:1-acyl-sn-glycerol-3-phosphate acyltransferase
MRAVFCALLVVPMIIIGVPLQWLALKLDLDVARWLPVLFHRVALFGMGVKLHVRGRPLPETPTLIVSNHVSWLDIPVIGSLAPLSFVSKIEVASWPVFGAMAKLQRTVFVDRDRRQKTGDVNAAIASRLAAGDAIVLFAEGTSSDGNRVLPFRSALVGAARDAVSGDGQRGRVWVQPLSIAYIRLEGMPMGRQHRPVAAWVGDMDMISHLKAMLARGVVDVVVTWGEPIPFDGQSDRKRITRDTETAVRRMTSLANAGRPAAEPSVA